MAQCFILYSVLKNKFYIGSCEGALTNDIIGQISAKPTHHRRPPIRDWKPYLSINTSDLNHAQRLSEYIQLKSKRNKMYVCRLKNNSELLQKAIDESL